MNATYAERAAAGIVFMKGRYAASTMRRRLNLNSFNIGDPCDCYIGQMTGCYEIGRERFKLTHEQCVALGFFATEGTQAEQAFEYAGLTAAFKDQLVADPELRLAA